MTVQMTAKTTAFALVLLLAPASVFAMGCSGQEHQTQSCAAGMTWDNEEQSCVKKLTG